MNEIVNFLTFVLAEQFTRLNPTQGVSKAGRDITNLTKQKLNFGNKSSLS